LLTTSCHATLFIFKSHRLYGADGHALLDILVQAEEDPPEIGTKVLCRHPFLESKRAYANPDRIESLYKVYWKDGEIKQPLPPLIEKRQLVKDSLARLRQDHKRNLNPTPYKVRRESITFSLSLFYQLIS